jgi:RNA polymerase sigma-70 factor, ECF subfamily
MFEHMPTMTVPSASGEVLPEALAEIFREHYQLIYRTAFSVTGSKQDAEDVLQTIFLRLLQRDLPLKFRTTPQAYLYRAAVNLALNTLRSRKRQHVTEDLERLEAPASEGDSMPSTEDERIQQTLLDAIARLRPRAVEILILHYEHNFSDAEIAKMLGKSRGTIAVSLYRARARLKKLMHRALAGGKR